ncbi:MAG: hypothetical protein KA745_00085 [Gemmatimonadales bacterium]|nr:hypothetical protein [Gemmatimonadales bacterium]
MLTAAMLIAKSAILGGALFLAAIGGMMVEELALARSRDYTPALVVAATAIALAGLTLAL